jgi:hypothetical protein
MYRIGDLSPVYRDRNILARNNLERIGRSAACFQPLPNFCRLPLPEPRLVVSSLGRIRIVNSPMLMLLSSALLANAPISGNRRLYPGSALRWPIYRFWDCMFFRLTGV